MNFLLARLFGILSTILLFHWSLSKNFYIYLGIGHYFMALYYAKRMLIHYTRAGNRIFAWAIIGILAATSALMMIIDSPPMSYYFGLHLILTDVYLVQNHTQNKFKTSGFFTLVRCLINSFSYLYLTNLGFGLWSSQTNLIVYGGSWLLFLGMMVFERQRMVKSYFYSIASYEGLVLAAILVLPKGAITFPMILSYHFMYWLIYPVLQAQNQSIRFIVNYSLTTLVTTSFIFWVVRDHLQGQMILNLLAYFHITFSLVSSRNNPQWILTQLRVSAPKAGLS